MSRCATFGTLITAVNGSGDGSFKLNGVSIAYNVNTDTISSVLTRINDSSAGVTAAYDAVNDRFTLSNGMQLIAIAPSRMAYAELSGFITLARRRAAKGEYR